MTPLRILSLGAGVQSSTLALMAERGAIPKVDAAIFSDTQGEPKAVYAWLDWLEKQVSYPIHRVTRGVLAEDELRIRRSGRSGNLYMKNSIPAFVLKADGGRGLLGRKCTVDYKITPIHRKVKELAGVKRGGSVVLANVLIGISWDEVIRMKQSRVPYIENSWPLIDLKMTRADCLAWMAANGYPVPPRSACSFCPFHSDDEWARLKKESPDEFAGVVEFERKLQEANSKQTALRGVPYLHSTCKPIGEVDFTGSKNGKKQVELFGNECEGLCGV
jgi:hypothetical protein